MRRHVLDKPKTHDDGIRTREFLRLDRGSGRHPAVRELHKRPHTTRSAKKVEAYVRIERGRDS